MCLHSMCVCVCTETGSMVAMVSLAVTSLLLLVLVVGSLICCIKKTRPVKRCEKPRHLSLYLRQLVSDVLSHELRFAPACIADAFSLPQDNPTRCFSQAAHEAAQASAPHTSASPYLWSLQLPKPANLCLHPGRRLRR